MLAFGNARRLFAEFHEWAPSPRATLRMVDAVGAEARGFLDAAAVPDNDGDVLVIQVDGRGAPMITATEAERRRKPRRKRCGTKRHARRRRRREHPRRRRKRGDKSKNAKVAFVGVLYTLRKTRRCGLKAPAPRGLVLQRASGVRSRGPFQLWLPSRAGAHRVPRLGAVDGEGGDDAENAGDRREVDGEAEVNGARLGRPGVEP